MARVSDEIPPEKPPLVEPGTLPEPVPVPPPPVRARRDALAVGVGFGALYGLAFYAVFFKYHVLPTVAFLVLVPAAMGAIPQLIQDEDQIDLYSTTLMRPMLAVLGFLVLSGVIFREAAVCMVVLALPFLAVSVLVSIVVWAWKARKLAIEKRKKAALLLAVLPLIWAPVEQWIGLPSEERSEVNAVEIAAAPDAVFSRLANVETIRPDEYPASVWDWLDVPRPIRATSSFEGPGARRTGEFEYGLRFDEVITTWQPAREMTFSVSVDPRTLREGSAERHAFETGYFRFLDASYRLTPTPSGTRLELSSRYVIRSGLNSYGRRWSHALISDFQARVLQVLKRRLENDQRALANRR